MKNRYVGINDRTVIGYVSRVGPLVEKYITEPESSTILAIGSHGRIPAMALRGHLYTRDLCLDYDDIAPPFDAPFKSRTRGRKVVIVGDPREVDFDGMVKDIRGQPLEIDDIYTAPVLNTDDEYRGNGINLGLNTPEIRRFVDVIGPRARDFSNDKPLALLSIPTGGNYYAMAMAISMIRQGVDVTYDEVSKTGGHFKTRKTRNRRVIAFDDRVNTGETLRDLRTYLDDLKREGFIVDFRTAVETDVIGNVADWTTANSNEVSLGDATHSIPTGSIDTYHIPESKRSRKIGPMALGWIQDAARILPFYRGTAFERFLDRAIHNSMEEK